MDSTIFENNLYLNDVFKLEMSQEYTTIFDTVSNHLHNYFLFTYKKLDYQDFIHTNDFYIHQIQFFLNVVSDHEKKTDKSNYGQILQNLILALEKPVSLAIDNKLIKLSVSDLRSFLIKNKQQSALINQVELLESKSKLNFDYILLLEKVCVLIKSIFDVGDTKTNNNYKLFTYINKSLTEEKFLEEKKILKRRNKMKSSKQVYEANFYNILPENVHDAFADQEIEKKIYFKANSDDEEDEVRQDKLIHGYKVQNEKRKKSKSNLFSKEFNGEVKTKRSITKKNQFASHNDDETNGANENGVFKYTYRSASANGMDFNKKNPEISVIEIFSRLNRKIRTLTGDINPIDEFEDDIFSSINLEHKFSITKIKLRPSYVNSNNNNIISDEMKITKEKSVIKLDSEIKPYNKERNNSIIMGSPNRRSMKIVEQKNDKLVRIYTNSKSTIQLPPNYMTEDKELKLLCDLINETTDAKAWKKVLEDKHIIIHKKSIDGKPQILLKSVAILEGFTKDEVFEAISNVKIRMQWDKVFAEFKVVETNAEDQSEILYMLFKSPSTFVNDRDFVQKRKIWKDFPDTDTALLHFKSVVSKLCPIKPKTIRADTIISGYCIKTISTNPIRTLVSIVSQTDIGGLIPAWIVNSVAQKAPREWVNSLMKGCEKVRANHK